MEVVGLYCNLPLAGQPVRGCQKVVMNLINGLKELDIEVKINTPSLLCGCLQATNEFTKKIVPKHALIGPEIMVFPDDIPNVWNYWKSWTQPSQWVIDNMKNYPIVSNNDFYVWPVGIDTNKFNEDNKNIKYDCFIYYKNVNKTTPIEKLKKVQAELNRRKLKYITLQYGLYKEEELIKATKECKFGVMVTGTESQGIAYMEILSSGIPLFVFDENYLTFRGREYKNKTNISSVPYFDNRCGIKVLGTDFNKIDEFLNNLNNYKPREYILENHTLKLGAEKYYNILKEVRG